MSVTLMDRVSRAVQVATPDEREKLTAAMQNAREFEDLSESSRRLVEELESRGRGE